MKMKFTARFTVKYYFDDEADLKFAPLGRLIRTDEHDEAPLMKAMQTVADKVGANRFDLFDTEAPDILKRVRRQGGAWNSNIVRREIANSH